MTEFRYERPGTVAEAVAFLAGAPGRARVLAGGTDLLLALRSGAARPGLLVDVKKIAEMRDIHWSPEGDLAIGAAVEVRRISEDEDISRIFPALAEGAGQIGSFQVRNRATIGGNLANASPCMDTAPPLLVLDARMRIVGPGGAREISLREFFVGVKVTALGPGEIVTAIVVPRPPSGLRTAFDKVKRIWGHDLALVNAAGAFDPSADSLRVAIGSCGVTPILLPVMSAADSGAAGRETAGQRLADLALEHVCPIDDVRSSAEYRRDMVALLCRRLAARLLGPDSRGR